MAVRVAANTDGLWITTNVLDYNSPYSILFWFYHIASISSYNCITTVFKDDWQNQDTIFTRDDTLKFGAYAVGSGADYLIDGGVLATNTWHQFALVREGTSALKCYHNNVLLGTNTVYCGGRSAVTQLSFGLERAGANWIDGRYAAIKAWQRALTADEVTAELEVMRPRNTSGLYGLWPLFPGSGIRTLDWSGNGHSLTEAGTLTDEESPPIPYGPKIYWIGTTTGATPVTINCTPAQLTLTGRSASITTGGVSVTCTRAQLALTGRAAAITKGAVSVLCTRAQLTLTGRSATIIKGVVAVHCTATALTLAGQTASLVKGGVSVLCSRGQLALTGQTAAIVVVSPGVITCHVGALALTGRPATIGKGAVSVLCARAQLSLTGQAATLHCVVAVLSHTGALTLTGQHATIQLSLIIVPCAVRPLILTGRHATIINVGGGSVPLANPDIWNGPTASEIRRHALAAGVVPVQAQPSGIGGGTPDTTVEPYGPDTEWDGPYQDGVS